MHKHQPDENLAAFTNEEILRLIGSGTVGAFSEIYRRRIDSSTNEQSIPRVIHDAALLVVLKQVLDAPPATSEELEALIVRATGEAAARHDLTEEASNVSRSWVLHRNVASVFSSLPDNWQRILWMREVEDFPPAYVAQRLNVTVHTATRLTSRARQEMRRRWQKAQIGPALSATELRTALIPALLFSPTLIERFADTLNDRPHSPPASSVPLAVEAAEVASIPEENEDGESGPEPAAEAAGAVEDAEVEKDSSPFRLPKPVLIPVAAACIGLLGSLVGLSISPISSEDSGFRTGVEPSSDSAGKEAGRNSDGAGAHSPSSGQSSDDGRAESNSPDTNDPPFPESSQGVDRDRSGPTSSRGDDDRTRGESSSGKKSDDRPGKPDQTGSEEPGSPGSSNPTKPDSPAPSEPEEPSDPAPSEPEEPSDPAPSEPEEPSDPAPSEPDEPSDPAPSEPDEPSDPAPSEPDEPSDPAPSESDEPSDPAPSESDEPNSTDSTSIQSEPEPA
ncbi:hypothetical protein [Brevibacterium atlanticum]|uniref:hypothetical protein n=1 Tax=Brevibacterium atlanticum TaxID=2697563 RepID=UPI001421D0DE|nr:hypothetical protein [Brevibacterium atlanticum]